MANIEDVLDSVKTIDGKMDTLIKWSGAVDERCKNHQEQTLNLHRTLYKNDSGIVAKVAKLWNGRKERTKLKDWLMKILGTVIGVSVLSFFAWLLWLYKKV